MTKYLVPVRKTTDGMMTVHATSREEALEFFQFSYTSEVERATEWEDTPIYECTGNIEAV